MNRRCMLACWIGSILVASACTATPEADRALSTAPAAEPSHDVCAMPGDPRPPPPDGVLRGRIAFGRDTSEVMILDLATGTITQVTSRNGRLGLRSVVLAGRSFHRLSI
jgi:hypothetical protein